MNSRDITYGIGVLFCALGVITLYHPLPRWIFLVCALFSTIVTLAESLRLLGRSGQSIFHKIVVVFSYVLSLCSIPLSFCILLFSKEFESAIDAFSLIAFGTAISLMHTKEKLAPTD